MYHIRGMTLKEIECQTSIPYSTVHRSIKKTTKWLKEKINEHYDRMGTTD